MLRDFHHRGRYSRRIPGLPLSINAISSAQGSVAQLPEGSFQLFGPT